MTHGEELKTALYVGFEDPKPCSIGEMARNRLPQQWGLLQVGGVAVVIGGALALVGRGSFQGAGLNA
jgi:hypothetical protein